MRQECNITQEWNMQAVKFTLTFLNIQWLRSFSVLLPHPAGVHTCACHVTSLILSSEGDIRGWGGLPYGSDRDARRLACGGQLQNLASLRVYGTKSHYIGPFRFLAFIQKSVLVWSPLGVILSLSHSHTGIPQGFNFSFSTSIPITVIGECARGQYQERGFVKWFLWKYQ